MQIDQAVLLGLIQGVTEFLPVSSSGHLVIFQQLFGITESMVTFDVFLHLGTLTAVVVFFWKDILNLRRTELIGLAVGTIPAVIAGLLLSEISDQIFASTLLVGFALIVTGVLNLFSDNMLNSSSQKETKEVAPVSALKIGLWQALAIIPGISRSGSTVFGGLKNGLERQTAFRFSFLLSIPAILGASALEGYKVFQTNELNFEWLPIFLGVVAAFVAGFFCLKLLQYLIKEAKLKYFGWYCFLVGGLVIVVSLI